MTRLIRSARPTDLPQLATMTQRDAAWLRYLVARQKRCRWQLLVAEQEGAPVGFLVYEVLRPASALRRSLQQITSRLGGFAASTESSSLAQPAPVALIREVFVGPDWRRQGLAKALAGACLDRLEQVAVAEAQVIVAADDQPARQLFVGLGFRPSQYLLERDISDLPGTEYAVSRLADQSDLAQLAELMRWEIRYQQRLAQTIQLRPEIDWLRYVTAKLRQRDTALLVVERESRLVGYGEIRVIETGRPGLRQRLLSAFGGHRGAARPGERIGFVEDIYILPAFRKEGLAAALLADGVRWCQQHQIRIVQGSVWHANRVSLRFFSAAGCVLRQQMMSKALPISAGEGSRMAIRWWTWQWWRRLFRLAVRPTDLCLALRIFLLAAAVPWLMRLRLSRLAPWLTPKTMPAAPDAAQIDKIIRYTDLALAVGQPLVQAKCLTRGVTLCYFLRRAGLAVTLCFGVGELNSRFAGHCWLVKDGAPFSEPDDPTVVYTPIYVLPAPASPHPATPIAHASGR